MRSCATRLENLNGPTHTGWAPKFASPSDCRAVGDRIMPARSANWAISGENGLDSFRVTVDGSVTVTSLTLARSLLRAEVLSVRCRSRLVFTAVASIGVPSEHLHPGRCLILH